MIRIADKDLFQYHIDENSIISADIGRSIVCKGVRFDEQGNRTSCVMKFKSKKAYSSDIPVLNHCSEILDVIDDFKLFICSYNGQSITISSKDYFCIVEKFIEGDTLEMYCLKFNNIGLVTTTAANQTKYYFGYREQDKLVCRQNLTKRFYHEFQAEMYKLMIQTCGILESLADKQLFPYIKAENIIVDKNGDVFLVGFDDIYCTDKPKGTLQSTVFSFGAAFWLCLSFADILTNDKNILHGSSEEIANHDFLPDQNTDFSLPKVCDYDKSLRKIIRKCTGKKTYKSYNKLKSAIKFSEKSYSRKTAFRWTAIILLIIALLGAGSAAGLKFKEMSEKNETLSVSEEVQTTEATTISEKEIIENATNALKDYIDDKKSYDDAKEAIDKLPETDNEDINKISADFQAVVKSKENFLKGDEQYNACNYEEAIEYFKNVDPLDKNNYELAQKNIYISTDIYRKSKKQEAEEAFERGEYKSACDCITQLAEKYPEDSDFADECMNTRKDYVKPWIESQRQSNNYFGEDGAVILAYRYSFFDVDGGFDNLKQNGYNYEKQQLIDMINAKRSEYSYSLLEDKMELDDIAERGAESRLKTGYDPEIPEYNRNYVTANSAQEVMETEFLNYLGNGPFLENSNSIGVGIRFNEQEMKCYWVILSASETEFT